MFINILEESADSFFTAILKMDAQDYRLSNYAASLSQKTVMLATAVQNFKYHLPVAVNDRTL
jgi:hypothetical protein